MVDFNILFYSSPNPMWVFDICNLQILEVNNASLKEYGYTKEEFLSKTIKDLRPADDIQLVEGILPQIRDQQTHFREFRHQDSTGNIFRVEIMSHPINFEGKEARLVVTQNVEEKKAIEGRLAFTQEKLNTILETTSIGIFQVDHQNVITYWNNAAEKLIGYDREYISGRNIWAVFPEAVDTDFYVQYQQAVQSKKNVEFVSYFWPIQKWFVIVIYYVREGLVMHFRDVTENKVYEERLLEKIDQLKEISYLNSHYMRKPIASLLGLTGLINNDLISADEFKTVAENIQECSLELDGIVRKVNNKINDEFGQISYTEVNTFSLNELVSNIIAEIQQQQNTHTVVLKNKEVVTCYGDEQSVAQALKHLIHNAIRFSPGEDTVEVCLDIVNSNAIVAVKDFGRGIDAQLLNRIFLSFSKKSVAKELGSGLAKVSDTAQRHNGNIWVESKPGKGSIFSIRLPMSNIGAYKHVGSTNFSDYQGPGIEVSHDQVLHNAVAIWEGFHTLHSIKTGCLKLLNLIRQTNAKCILNDNTLIAGTWNEAVDWVSAEYFPMLQNAGVTHIAWVYSPSTFSRLSADMTIASVNTNIVIKTFENADAAGLWLQEAK